MKKYLMLLMILLLALPMAVFAQDDEGEDADDMGDEMAAEVEPWECPEGFEGQTLSIYNWSTYIAEDTVPNFEELCGVSVTYDTYDSGETMQQRIRQGNPGYDIVVPSGDTIGEMIAEGLLIPLNKDMIPNIVNLDEQFLDPPYDPGNEYSLPYQWGTVGLGYNTEVFPDGITSWEDMYNHDGPVAWLDDRRATFGVALLALGYDPGTTNPDEIAEARDYLIERGGNVVTIAGDDGQVLLERGEVDITVEYSGDIFALAFECECDTYNYVIPAEGTNIWTDNVAIPIDAPNPELAMVFIDYVLHPQVGADISNYTAYATPNEAALSMGFIDAELVNDPAIYPSADGDTVLFFNRPLPADAQQLYNDAWDELLIFLGQ